MKGRKPRGTSHVRLVDATETADGEFDATLPARPKMPTCPGILNGEARKEWDRVVREMVDLGLWEETDRMVLAGYCQIFGRWVKAERALAKARTLIMKSPNGYPVQHPLVSVANRSLEMLLKFASEFGFTPVARRRLYSNQLQLPLAPASPEGRDAVAAYLSEGGAA